MTRTSCDQHEGGIVIRENPSSNNQPEHTVLNAERRRTMIKWLAVIALLAACSIPTSQAQSIKAKLPDKAKTNGNDSNDEHDDDSMRNSKLSTDDEEEKHPHLWGAAPSTPSESAGSEGDVASEEDQDGADSEMAEGAHSSPDRSHDVDERKPNGNGKLSFVGSKGATMSSSHMHHGPPEGFRLTSRVYTNSTDRLAYFDDETALVLPYWECGMFGSTTGPVPLQHATVRHLLAGSKPHRLAGGADTHHPTPQIVVPLSPVEIVLSSGESRAFGSGDVILLENAVHGGHKLQPIGSDSESMTVILLTLPQSYTHVGKDRISIKNLLRRDATFENPCPEFAGTENDASNSTASATESSVVASWRRRAGSINVIRTVPARKYILAFVGASLSALMGDFLGKVAPLWLAVGMGGVCFIGGGTVAFVKAGDFVLDEMELWRERRRRRLILERKTEDDRIRAFGVNANGGVGEENIVEDDESPSETGNISGISPSFSANAAAAAAAAAKQSHEEEGE